MLVCLAAVLRFTGLNWDLAQWIHPDEGHMRAVTGAIAWPENLGDYFATARSPLNPRNNNQLYSYGTLPLFATRAVAEWLDGGCGDATQPLARLVAGAVLTRLAGTGTQPAGWTCTPGTFTWTYNAFLGRHLSALADVGTVILAALIARHLYGTRAALLALGLSATTAFMIQQAHFYTVDSAATFFTALTAYAAVRAAQMERRRPWGWLALGGLGTGLATACKVSAALAAGLVALGAVAWARRGVSGDPPSGSPSERSPHPDRRQLRAVLRALRRVAPVVLLSAALSVAAFRVAQPYAFVGPGLLDLELDPVWYGRLQQIREEQSGIVDYPSGRQWTNRLPVVFPLRNIVVWGMGLPLGIAAWIGWAVCGVELAKGRREHLTLWVWTTAYFAFYASQWVKAMRYFLPIYPLLIVMAAYAVERLLLLTDCRREVGASVAQRKPRLGRGAALGATLVVLGGTALWGAGLLWVYVRPHTRIAASRWIYDNVPDGSTVANEHWDWGLPLRIDGLDGFSDTGRGPTYTGFQMALYDEDTPDKLERLLAWLDDADYIFLASNRLYGSIPRLPERYPLTTTYYRALFDGTLGFTLSAQFTSYIQLGPLAFPDQENPFPLLPPNEEPQGRALPIAVPPAEESFSVYDHPNCLIFRKAEDYSATQTRAALEAVDLTAAEIGRTPQDATPQSVHAAHRWAFAGLLALAAVGGISSLLRQEEPPG